MKIKLSAPRVLHDGTQEGSRIYGKGSHTIPEGVAKHWFTRALLKSGDISQLADDADLSGEKSVSVPSASKAAKDPSKGELPAQKEAPKEAPKAAEESDEGDESEAPAPAQAGKQRGR